MADFNQTAGMPLVIIAVDGLLIPIKEPHDQERLYVCHKSFHVINTMVVCNAQLSFTKNCSKDSYVNHNNRPNSFHANYLTQSVFS